MKIARTLDLEWRRILRKSSRFMEMVKKQAFDKADKTKRTALKGRGKVIRCVSVFHG